VIGWSLVRALAFISSQYRGVCSGTTSIWPLLQLCVALQPYSVALNQLLAWWITCVLRCVLRLHLRLHLRATRIIVCVRAGVRVCVRACACVRVISSHRPRSLAQRFAFDNLKV
jgi:hypothetical protein